MKTLNVIGAGRVGRTLAALWSRSRTFEVQDVLARTARSSRAAIAFIGSGRAASKLSGMRAAEVWLLATPDGAIPSCEKMIAARELLRPGDVVFHCSGTLSSSALRAAADAGARVASVHPLKTFADPSDAVRTFEGTYCAIEGDRAALAVLRPAFRRIGAQLVTIDARRKVLYHAASVIVCNDLTALLEAGLRTYGKAGVTRAAALRMMESLVRETVDNVFRLGTARALTGPVARGDIETVRRHLEALEPFDARIASLYADLGKIAVELAAAQRSASASALALLKQAFDESPRRSVRNRRG